ncbi:MAG: hypothetical protein ACI8RD_008295 [Bacillariaceae sp.]|jgi:hypothetical protein
MFRPHFTILRSAVVVGVVMASLISKSATLRQRCFVASFSYIDTTAMSSRTMHSMVKDLSTNKYPYFRKTQSSIASLQMSTSTSSSASPESIIIPRVKAVDAKESTDGSPVLIKGWVRTVRKQKTLAFVEVNDGSNMNGIQCVLSFDDIDEETQKGTHICLCNDWS